jgi:hypothetical protein
VYAIAHEIGHAIDLAPLRAAWKAYEAGGGAANLKKAAAVKDGVGVTTTKVTTEEGATTDLEHLKGGVTAYLLPGIYWIGGGGFQTSNDASVISVDDETDRTRAVCTLDTDPLTPPCVGGGGVLIYNSKLANSAAGPISLGGGGASLSLQPFDYPFGTTTIDLVIFQDRTVTTTVTLNGSSSQAAEVRGIVYVPAGEVKVNGSSSVFSMDQVIADTFLIDGSGGTVNVLRETGVDAEISAVGLVE